MCNHLSNHRGQREPNQEEDFPHQLIDPQPLLGDPSGGADLDDVDVHVVAAHHVAADAVRVRLEGLIEL